MRLNGRRKIAIAVAGVAGAAALGMGGVALAADPSGGESELRIVSGYQEEGATQAQDTEGEDCPWKGGGGGGGAADPAQAANDR
jgi:hypothetical protein